MEQIFLPTLHTFAMDNIFTGSCGLLRFRAVPQIVKRTDAEKEVDMDRSSIFVEYWHGLMCYEKSQMEGSQVFPMSEEGRETMRAWLEAKI